MSFSGQITDYYSFTTAKTFVPVCRGRRTYGTYYKWRKIRSATAIKIRHKHTKIQTTFV